MDIGIKNIIEKSVSANDTAEFMGSGTLCVFATPAMIALMEETAWRSVDPYLETGQSTVGISLDIKHLCPTPLGMKVRCESTLTEIDGRRLKFTVHVYDEVGLIGSGIHERFIVNAEKFQSKANNKTV